jgi:hypothetical protein
MKTAFLLLFICCFASWTLGQQGDEKKKAEQKDRKLLESVNIDSLDLKLKRKDVRVQEQTKRAEFSALLFPTKSTHAIPSVPKLVCLVSKRLTQTLQEL